MYEDQNERNGAVDPEVVNYYYENKPEKKTRKWPYFLVGFICLFAGCLITAIVGLGLIGSRLTFKDEASTEVLESLQKGGSENSKFSTIINIIETYYYKDVDDDALVNGVYKGVVESLDDPYSEYYTAEEYEDLMATLTGNYAGIGALLQKNAETGAVSITKVYKNTPAEKSGLLEGDIIVSADGYLGTDEGLDTFVQHIRGEAGTDVELVILRENQELTFVCTRAAIATPTVEHQMIGEDVGYIAVSQFTEHTYKDFVEAYKDLEKQGMTSVIFDMRNNGGGLVDSVVEMLDFLRKQGLREICLLSPTINSVSCQSPLFAEQPQQSNLGEPELALLPA